MSKTDIQGRALIKISGLGLSPPPQQPMCNMLNFRWASLPKITCWLQVQFAAVKSRDPADGDPTDVLDFLGVILSQTS